MIFIRHYKYYKNSKKKNNKRLMNPFAQDIIYAVSNDRHQNF